VLLLASATQNFAAKLVDGIEADREHIAALVENSPATATALAPAIGYDNAAAMVKEAYRPRRSVREPAREKSAFARRSIEQSARSRATGRRLMLRLGQKWRTTRHIWRA
jgi:fumarate hydratase class II